MFMHLMWLSPPAKEATGVAKTYVGVAKSFATALLLPPSEMAAGETGSPTRLLNRANVA
jgi:hypothetical protein